MIIQVFNFCFLLVLAIQNKFIATEANLRLENCDKKGPVLFQSIDTVRTYASIKMDIIKIKANKELKRLSQDSLSNLITDLLVNRIIPYWMGTKWSFEGHTSNPGLGEIACGYFVSTTLRDVGFNLDKYKFAQQLPKNEARSLNAGHPLLEIIDNSTAGRIKTLKETLKEGLYFIGFDNSHVGFLYYKNPDLILIHSNYIDARGVVTEPVEKSEVFSSYDRIFIAKISTNRALLKNWITNTRIKIVTE